MKCDMLVSSDSSMDRLPEEEYGEFVWKRNEVIDFLEHNIGLSKSHRIPGRIVCGHNEALFFWQELIVKDRLLVPFDVIHVDSHADLGLGYASWNHICREMLAYPVEERPKHSEYEFSGNMLKEGIGDYLLYAIAYRMLSSITYCGNPYKDNNDYLQEILKGFKEEYIYDKPVRNIIQLLYNKNCFPYYDSSEVEKREFIKHSVKEPEVPFIIIPTIEDVNFNGAFDYAVMAQSPNYTPASADFIIDIFRSYIEEI